jgi:hypothetical protein
MPEPTPTDRRTADSDEPDVSAGWREEYAAQGVDAAIRPDGGRVTEELRPGSRAVDRDDRDDAEVLVLEATDTAACEYTIDALEKTVAECNLEYPPEADVVEAAYVDEVEYAVGGWRTVEDLRDAVAFGAINSYSFPAPRLRPTDGGPRRETSRGLAAKLTASNADLPPIASGVDGEMWTAEAWRAATEALEGAIVEATTEDDQQVNL